MHVLKTCRLNFGKSVHVLIKGLQLRDLLTFYETFNNIVTKARLGEKYLRI